MNDNQSETQSQGATPPPASPSAPKLFDAYSPRRGLFDEYRNPPDSSLWDPFVERVNVLGAERLAAAWKRGEDLLRENGIAHNILSDTPETERRWALDPIPFILSEGEWEFLSRAVDQRAQLWNRILHDCYGPQRLLASGALPPALFYAQASFNRSLRHLPDPDHPLLSLYAVDVARGPDGAWTVIADRTEAPNGTGFALENRLVATSVFPDTSKRLHLLRLAPYFQALRAMLFAQAPSAIDSPRVVLLSPGPGDKTYFEDAFLSRYLGITLAVGQELTVRGDRLYLKTVSGLQRVHVLMRRVPETGADPLETPCESARGVPGLMQVLRAGAIKVLNPPGTGLVEAPAFLPSLPSLARDLLDQDLLIPSIETHWDQDQSIASRIDPASSVIKSAFERRSFPPAITRHLSRERLDTLRKDIEANPSRYVLQREMPFSTAPAWNGSSLEPRPVAIRLFAFADGDQYRVMPGGLVRCAVKPDSLPGLSVHEETHSKDLWVISSRQPPATVPTNIRPYQPLRRANAGTLASRSADNMFWIGRYSERAEFVTRILLEIVHEVTSERDDHELPTLPSLFETLVQHDYLDSNNLELKNLVVDRVLLRETLQPLFFLRAPAGRDGLDSVPDNLGRLRSLAALSRDRLSNESWRIIQSLEELVRSPLPSTLSGFRPALQRAILYQSAFNGTCRENLTRSEGWRFLNIGRKLERSSWMLTLIEQILGLYPELPSPVLDAALSIADCTLTYRFRYQGAPTPLPALDLLLYDPAIPRGLAFQLADLDRDFRDLPPPSPEQILRPAHRIIIRALNYLQTEFLPAENPELEEHAIEQLRCFVSDLREQIPTVAEQLNWEFFTHATFTAS